MQKFSFKSLLPEFKLDEAGELKATYNSRVRAVYMILLLLISGFNFYAVSPLALRHLLKWSQTILYAVRFDTVEFETISFVQIQVIVAYILALILGGFLVFLLVRFTISVGRSSGILQSSKSIAALLCCFVVAFIFGGVMAFINDPTYYHYELYRWLCPLLAYIGGLLMHTLSGIKVNVE